VVRDRALAIDTALDEARPGDVVLIAGKGHEDYQIVGHERRAFSDRACVLHRAGVAP
jgi:UDP-N-acetylmuramoyl-L-alanyl-D-glutamate--2,6-diaminopimelate ligase